MGPTTAQLMNKEAIALLHQLRAADYATSGATASGDAGVYTYQRIKLCDLVPELKDFHGGFLDLS